MKEVKTPKKPLIYFYGAVLIAILLFNLLFMPMLTQSQIQEVDYGTFMTMTENKEIGQVEVQDSQILFTDKENEVIYQTASMNDPELVERLYASGAQFNQVAPQQMSPFLGIWVC